MLLSCRVVVFKLLGTHIQYLLEFPFQITRICTFATAWGHEEKLTSSRVRSRMRLQQTGSESSLRSEGTKTTADKFITLDKTSPLLSLPRSHLCSLRGKSGKEIQPSLNDSLSPREDLEQTQGEGMHNPCGELGSIWNCTQHLPVSAWQRAGVDIFSCFSFQVSTLRHPRLW